MELRDLSAAMQSFVTAKGWYQPGSPRPQTLRNIAISLNLETAEVLEHLQWAEQPEDPEQFAGELADVALYLLQLAHLCRVDLEAAVLAKLEVNYRRSWDGSEVQ